MRAIGFICRSGAMVLVAVALEMGMTALLCGTVAASQSTPPSLAPMLHRVMPSVVTITAKGKSDDEEDGTLYITPGSTRRSSSAGLASRQASETAGTGVITDAQNGYILTNDHVIDGATSIDVTIDDGTTYEAAVIGADEDTDLAVIRISAHGLTAAELGDSSSLKVGDYVVAVGTPFGLGKSATFGIVSALDRGGSDLDREEGFIQTDASLNPGNSGGALVDLDGKIVGINTAILGGFGANLGIGFAVPINTAGGIMQQLIAHGEIRRGQLGIQVQDNSADLAKALGVEVATGAVVNDVPGQSPGGKAGVMVGDVVAAVNGVPIAGADQLRARVSSLPPETVARLSIVRPKRTVDVDVILGNKDSGAPGETVEYVDGQGLLARVILQTLDSTSDAFRKVHGGAVTSVLDGSAAATAGLQPGDVITSVNRTDATTPQMVVDLSRASTDFLLLGIFRDGHKSFLVVKR